MVVWASLTISTYLSPNTSPITYSLPDFLFLIFRPDHFRDAGSDNQSEFSPGRRTPSRESEQLIAFQDLANALQLRRLSEKLGLNSFEVTHRSFVLAAKIRPCVSRFAPAHSERTIRSHSANYPEGASWGPHFLAMYKSI